MDALVDGRLIGWCELVEQTSRAAYGGRDRGHHHGRGSAHQEVAPVQKASHRPIRTRRGGIVAAAAQQRDRRAATLDGCPTQLLWRVQQWPRR